MHESLRAIARCCVAALGLRVAAPAPRGRQGTAADDGRHPDAAGADAAAAEPRSASLDRGAQGGQRAASTSRPTTTARRSPIRSCSSTTCRQRPPRRPREGRRQQRADRLADAGGRGAAAVRRSSSTLAARPSPPTPDPRRRRRRRPAPRPRAAAARSAAPPPPVADRHVAARGCTTGARPTTRRPVRSRDHRASRPYIRTLPEVRAGRRRAGLHRPLVPAGRQERQGGRGLRPGDPQLSDRRRAARGVLQEGAWRSRTCRQHDRARARSVRVRRQDVSRQRRGDAGAARALETARSDAAGRR